MGILKCSNRIASLDEEFYFTQVGQPYGQSEPLHARNYIVNLAIHGHGYSEMQQSYRPVINRIAP
jgi:hypothetical protein